MELAIVVAVSVATGLVANELHAHGSWLARRLVRIGSLFVPWDVRNDRYEEWCCHLDEIAAEGRHGAALIWSIGAMVGGIRINSFRRRPASSNNVMELPGELFSHSSDRPYVHTSLGAGSIADRVVMIQGRCRLVRDGCDFFGNGTDWESPILDSPTMTEVLEQIIDSIQKTGDRHHVFLEDLDELESDADGTRVFEPSLGS